jgi:hypothetical protein
MAGMLIVRTPVETASGLQLVSYENQTEWHIGEPLPEIPQGSAFQANGDELNLITRAMEISVGSNEWIGYGKFQGFQSKLNETLHKAAYAVYRRVFWNLTTEPSAALWENLREALGIARDNFISTQSTSQLKWLIEYRTARPLPAYATADTFPTFDPKAARQFDTRDQCQSYMLDHGYGSPWHATEHKFIGR